MAAKLDRTDVIMSQKATCAVWESMTGGKKSRGLYGIAAAWKLYRTKGGIIFELLLFLLTKVWDSYLSIAQKTPC